MHTLSQKEYTAKTVSVTITSDNDKGIYITHGNVIYDVLNDYR